MISLAVFSILISEEIIQALPFFCNSKNVLYLHASFSFQKISEDYTNSTQSGVTVTMADMLQPAGLECDSNLRTHSNIAQVTYRLLGHMPLKQINKKYFSVIIYRNKNNLLWAGRLILYPIEIAWINPLLFWPHKVLGQPEEHWIVLTKYSENLFPVLLLL